MKRQEKAAIQGLGVDELKAQLRETEEKLFKLKFANALAPLKNSLQIRNLKRHKARLLTWIGEKKRTQSRRISASNQRESAFLK